MSHKCFVAGCKLPAPYGIRFPGLLSDLPPDMGQPYLWHCRDHAELAKRRRDDAMKRRGWAAPDWKASTEQSDMEGSANERRDPMGAVD